MIDTKDIHKLAELSRITLTTEETEKMQKDINSILSYVEQIQAVSAEGVGTFNEKNRMVKRDFHVHEVKNVMRADGPAHESGVHTDALLAASPDQDGGYFKVKKILQS